MLNPTDIAEIPFAKNVHLQLALCQRKVRELKGEFTKKSFAKLRQSDKRQR
jgi:hypothetical protein